MLYLRSRSATACLRHRQAGSQLARAISTSRTNRASVESAAGVAFSAEHDVIVVGSGAAGSASALAAALSGCKDVLMLEKDKKVIGGTTAKSGGIFWIPNNPLMQAQGIKDEKDDWMAYACRKAYEFKFNKSQPKFGLSDREYDLLSNYYDVGPEMVEGLVQSGVAKNLTNMVEMKDGTVMQDYGFCHLEYDNLSPTGRMLGIGSEPKVKGIIHSLTGVMNSMDGFIGWASQFAPGMRDLRLLRMFGCDVSQGVGVAMVGEFQKALKEQGVQFKPDAAVEALLTNHSGGVVGVRLANGDSLRAKKGVVFGSGGFSQNQDMLKQHLPHPVYMTGASAGNTGDFHTMAAELGAEMCDMEKIWGCQTFLEQSFEQWEDQVCLFQVRGDSMMIVNKRGVRVMNEKGGYDSRVRVHWNMEVPNQEAWLRTDDNHPKQVHGSDPLRIVGDPARPRAFEKQQQFMTQEGAEYPNQFLFLVGDERCVHSYGANFAKTWPNDPKHKYYIKGETMAELSANIAARLQEIEPALAERGVAPFALEAGFGPQLEETVERFNGFAAAGWDQDYQRGTPLADSQWTVSPLGEAENKCPSVAMHPLSASGPYYCLILAPSIIDTKGGPAINTDSQIMKTDGSAIEGLYGAGNSAAPMSGDAYWSGGATIGSAMIGGWQAGKHAAAKEETAL